MVFHEYTHSRILAPLKRLGGSWLLLLVITAITAIATRFFPLVDELHYEYSALVALVCSLFCGVAVVFAPRDGMAGPADTGSPDAGPSETNAAPEARLWGSIGRAVLCSLLPLAVGIVLALFGDSCGLADGIVWYLLLVPAAAAIGAILACTTMLVTRRRWLALLLFLGLWSLSLIRGACEGYTGPHIFMYAWQVGFFPGGSWDAELPVTPLLTLYRAGHLAIAFGLLAVVCELARIRAGVPFRMRRALLVFGTLGAAAGLLLLPYRSELGLSRTDTWLQQELGDSVRTRFATIYYNRFTTDSLDLWRAANLTDFYITEHAKFLEMREADVAPITLYLFASAAEQKRCVGTASAAFTKPWDRKLCLPFDRVGSTLRHELAHIMLEPYGNLLGISTSQGLLEGSAMAMENAYGWRTLHEYVRAMYAFNLAPPAEEVMGVRGFSSYRTSVSYVLAGSFSKWLIDSFGIRRYLNAYAWGDFEEAYGSTLHELSERYSAFINTMPAPPPLQGIAMRHMFGGGSFFTQHCLRRIGTLNGKGYESLGEERYAEAMERFGGSLKEGINYGARGGIIRALWGLGRFREMLDSCAVYARDTASYPLLPYLVEQGDACWALGDTARARRFYDSMLALDVNEGLTVRAGQRLWFMASEDSVRQVMRQYFTRPARLMQRLMLLDRAYALATSPEDRYLLLQMRTLLTMGALPYTSARDFNERDRAVSNAPGVQDSAMLHARLPAWHMMTELLNDRLGELFIMTGTVRHSLTAPMIQTAPGSSPENQEDRHIRGYRFERVLERGRFVKYLRQHSLRP